MRVSRDPAIKMVTALMTTMVLNDGDGDENEDELTTVHCHCCDAMAATNTADRPLLMYT